MNKPETVLTDAMKDLANGYIEAAEDTLLSAINAHKEKS